MKITAYKCPWTSQLFEFREDYTKHLKALQRERKREREIARKIAEFDKFKSTLYRLGTTDEIAVWITDNIDDILLFYNSEAKRKLAKKTEKDTFKCEISKMRFNDKSSTTHSAPLGQKTTGWHREHIPEAAWEGRIRFTFTGRMYYDLFNSRIMGLLGINTGSGGGSSKGLEYDLTLFTKDFVKLAEIAIAHRTHYRLGRMGIDSNWNVLDKPLGYSRRDYFDDDDD